jgi:hypothetical protein
MRTVAAKLTDAEREDILATFVACDSVNETARRHRRSAGTVSRIVANAGLVPAARSKTKTATAAAKFDAAHERTALHRRLLAEANGFLDRLHEPHTAFSFGGKDNTYNEHEMAEPPVADQRSLMVMVGIAVDKSIAIEKAERGDDTEGAALIEALVGGLRGAA